MTYGEENDEQDFDDDEFIAAEIDDGKIPIPRPRRSPSTTAPSNHHGRNETMTMTVNDLASAIDARCKHLAGLGKLPPPVASAPALRAIAVVSLLAETDIRHTPTPDSTAPQLTIPGYVGTDGVVENLLARADADRGRAVPAAVPGRTISAPSAWLGARSRQRSSCARSNTAPTTPAAAPCWPMPRTRRATSSHGQRLGEQHARPPHARCPALLSNWDGLGAPRPRVDSRP